MLNKLASVARGRFVEQKLKLSSSFRCDQIQKVTDMIWLHFVVPLKSDLDVQQTHLSTFIKTSFLVPTLSVTKFSNNTGIKDII